MQSEKSTIEVSEESAAPRSRYQIRRVRTEDLPGAFELVQEYFEAIQGGFLDIGAIGW
jgi:hypothetical protein